MLRTTSLLIPLSLLACNGADKDTSTTTEETAATDGSSWARGYVQQLEKTVQLNPELKEINKLEQAYLAVSKDVFHQCC